MNIPRVLAGALVCGTALVAVAQDTGWKTLQKRYASLARNHDVEANRERRYVLLDMFPFRGEKACRRLLKKAFDDEKDVANRVAVTHLLSGSGNPKDLDFLVSKLKKEKARGPVIAIGAGLGYTPRGEGTTATDVTKRVLTHLKRAKGDLRVSLIRGLGELADPAALPWLTACDDEGVAERHERNLALGLCGGESAVPLLVAETAGAIPGIRLGAARGLAAIHGEAAWKELARLLADSDERVVRTAAAALAADSRKEAMPALAAAMSGRHTLRTIEVLRAALRDLSGRDLGHDAASWAALAAGKNVASPASLPKLSMVFGLPVASDRVALLIDRSRSTGWMGRLERMRGECSRLVRELPGDTDLVLASARRDLEPFGDGWVPAGRRSDAAAWIDELEPGGGFDMRKSLGALIEGFPGIDTIIVVTDSHPWGNGITPGSRETMEIFRRENRLRDVRLVIALVMPGGRYEPSERSESEIDERVDYLTEMAEDSAGAFVLVDE